MEEIRQGEISYIFTVERLFQQSVNEILRFIGGTASFTFPLGQNMLIPISNYR